MKAHIIVGLISGLAVGCVPMATEYYKPSGAGIVGTADGTGGEKNVIRGVLSNQVNYIAAAYRSEDGGGVSLRLTLVVPEGARVKLTTNFVRIEMPESKQALNFELSNFEGRTLVAGRVVSEPQPVLSELVGATRVSGGAQSTGPIYFGTSTLITTAPTNFVAHFPNVTINGITNDFQAIRFDWGKRVNLHSLGD